MTTPPPPPLTSDGTYNQETSSVAEEFEAMGGVEYRMPAPLRLDSNHDLLPQWVRFKQQFQIFLTAAGFDRLSDNRKTAILLNSVGPEAQDLYCNVLRSDETALKYEQIIELFDNYFAPKQNELMNTYKFHRRAQEEGEMFDLFYTALKKQVKNCNFRDQEERMLRDRIVLGIYDKNLQRRLLEANDLTLQKAVDLCRASEISRDQCSQIQQASQSAAVDAVQGSSGQPAAESRTKAKYSSNSKEYNCKKCGTWHKPRNCPAYGKICSNCHKPNHFKKGCKFINKVSQVSEGKAHNEDNNVHDL